MNLFEREIELTVGNTIITGLDIAFEIEKDLTPEPNPCHVEIYNLGPENRTILSKYDRVPVMLKAGYKDATALIYKGDMISCRHVKEGPTWKSVLANGDGANAIQTARIKKSYAKGTPVKTVVQDLAKELNLPHDNAKSHMDMLNKKLERGLGMGAYAWGAFCKMISSQGYIASIQNQALQVQKKGKALQREAISLSPDSGLIAAEMGSKGMIEIKCLIMPELSPGRKVHIDSALFKGFATIQSVRFSGANFEAEWEAELILTNNLS